jgi:GNAT superfamily N-acetyltransferase
VEIESFDDVEAFWVVAGPVLAADPVRNTVAITVVAGLRAAEPATTPILLVVRDNDSVTGILVRSPPFPVIVTALPAACAPAVVGHLLAHGHDPGGATGTRAEVDAFAMAWLAATGVRSRVRGELRLYRLGRLVPPANGPGRAELATEADVPLLGRWLREFVLEADLAVPGAPSRSAEEQVALDRAAVRRALRLGNDRLIWWVDGEPVSFAGFTAPLDGMSRLAPVYTPPEHRGRGYGSAVTAAASARAIAAGARDVVLFTDLANPVSNSIYRKIGYRPRFDAREVTWATA